MTKIKIDRLALDGDGIGRLEAAGPTQGQAAFVPYALAEEIVDAALLTQKKNHSRWLPIRIEKPSPHRIDPPCPFHFRPGLHAKSWCGGCNWQQIKTDEQRIAKRQLLIETLERIGGVARPQVHPTISSPDDWRYRNKVQVPFGRKGNGFAAGFYAPGSHDIVEFDDCLIQTPLSVQLVTFVKKYARENRWVPYDEDRHSGWIRHLLVRTNETGQALVALICASDMFPDKNKFLDQLRREFPQVIGVSLNVQKARTHVILGATWRHLWGQEKITEIVGGLKISFGAGSFFQVNKKAADILYAKAIEELDIQPNDIVMDVFCGVGAMTLMAAKKARHAIGVEVAQSAVRDAEKNAQANHIKNVEFIAGEAENILKSDRSGPFEYLKSLPCSVILDPPRSGCDERVLRFLLDMKPRRIAYVSCHPATLARDIKILSSHYSLASATPVDLFPQTAHIETVARLERNDVIRP